MPLFSIFASEDVIIKDQAIREGPQVDGTHVLLVYADNANLLGKIYIPESKTQKLYKSLI